MKNIHGFLSSALMITLLTTSGCSSLSSDETTATSACNGTETPTDRLFLQQLTATSVIIKWRGTADSVCLGTDPNHLVRRASAKQTAGAHHEALFDKLSPDTTYFYSVGGAETAPADQTFTTAPGGAYPSDDDNTRIWVIGDSGTAAYTHKDSDINTPSESHYTGIAEAVKGGMHSYTAHDGESIDLFLMLGDNAYNNGDDVNYQAAVFDTYPTELKAHSLWPTIGNHEMGVGFADLSAIYGKPTGTIQGYFGGISTSSDPNSFLIDGNAAQQDQHQTVPYIDIFSLPSAGEAGGISSGTEQYYAFDYGKVHIVSLDSQLSGRDTTQRTTMKKWLENDLANASLSADWIIVIFHHPPYSKGANHDSDSDAPTIAGAMPIDAQVPAMRNEFVPLFQQYGVDLVLNGHAHSYERSYYLTNLYATDPANDPTAGDSDRFDPQRNTQNGIAATGRDGYKEQDGYVIYSVAGNGGKADSSAGGLKDKTEWLNHRAMVQQPAYQTIDIQTSHSHNPKATGVDHSNGLALPGSLIIDANSARLQIRMIDIQGDVLDQFTIQK